jgi:hypothetical protein
LSQLASLLRETVRRVDRRKSSLVFWTRATVSRLGVDPSYNISYRYKTYVVQAVGMIIA